MRTPTIQVNIPGGEEYEGVVARISLQFQKAGLYLEYAGRSACNGFIEYCYIIENASVEDALALAILEPTCKIKHYDTI